MSFRLFFSIVLFTLLLIAPPYGRAEEDEACIDFTKNSFTSAQDFFTGLAQKTIGDLSKISLKETFGISKKPGEDLYMRIYSTLGQSPIQEAKRIAAQRYHIPEQNVEQILDGDLTPLYLRSSDGVTFTQAFRTRNQFMKFFQSEVKHQKLVQKVQAEVYATEIFANGKLEDSGFDLIYDLDLIEQILFGMKAQEQSGLSLSDLGGDDDGDDDSSSGSSVSSSSGDTSSSTSSKVSRSADDESAASSDSGESGDSGSTSEGDAASGSSVAETTSSDESASTSGSTFNPYECLASLTDLQEVVVKSEDESSSESAEENSDDSGDSADDSSSSEGGSEGASDESGIDGDGDSSADDDGVDSSLKAVSTGYNDSSGEPIEMASSSNWSKTTLPCTSIFCIEIEAVNNEEPAYPKNDHCIACHVSFITHELYKTNRNNLVANKITGNLFEVPACKEGVAKSFPPDFFSDRIVAIGKPISTPIQDDIVTKLDFEDSFWKKVDSFVSSPSSDKYSLGLSPYVSNEFTRKQKFCDPNLSPEEQEKSGCRKRLSDKATQVTRLSAPSGSSYLDIFKKIDTITNQARINAERSVSLAPTETKIKGATSFYQYLQPEMDQMNAYFTSFQNLIIQIAEGPAQNLCEKEDYSGL